MKSLFAAALVVLSSSLAFAYPAVNDSVTLEGTYSEQGQTFPLSLITTLKSFDASAGQFLQSETQILAGQVSTQDSMVDQGDLLTPAQVQSLIANCGAQGGTLETLATQAGALNACKLTQSDNDGVQVYWFADVPFGLAKAQIVAKNEQGHFYRIDLTLSAYTRGQ